jgi:hypothetical protein
MDYSNPATPLIKEQSTSEAPERIWPKEYNFDVAYVRADKAKAEIEDMKCCGNCGTRLYGSFDCGTENVLCREWKLRSK